MRHVQKRRSQGTPTSDTIIGVLSGISSSPPLTTASPKNLDSVLSVDTMQRHIKTNASVGQHVIEDLVAWALTGTLDMHEKVVRWVLGKST